MVENITSPTASVTQAVTSAKAQEEPKQKSWLKTAFEWLPYPVAAAIGYYSFDVEVKKSIYRNVAKHGYFNDMQTIRNRDYEAVLQRGAQDGKSIANELHTIEEKYRDVVHTTFRDKLGMTGMKDYWQGIQRNQKISALVMGATVTSIIVGAVLLIKENEKLRDAFVHKDRSNSSNDRI